MPKTEKQRRAACADYGRKKKGKEPRTFKNMSKDKLKDWCQGPLHKESTLLDNIEMRLMVEAEGDILPPGVKMMTKPIPSDVRTKGVTRTTVGDKEQLDQFKLAPMQPGGKQIDYDEEAPYELAVPMKEADETFDRYDIAYTVPNPDPEKAVNIPRVSKLKKFNNKDSAEEFIDEIMGRKDVQIKNTEAIRIFEPGVSLEQLESTLETHPNAKLYKIVQQGSLQVRQDAQKTKNVRPLLTRKPGDITQQTPIGEFDPETQSLRKWDQGEEYEEPKPSPESKPKSKEFKTDKMHEVTWIDRAGIKGGKTFRAGVDLNRIEKFMSAKKKAGCSNLKLKQLSPGQQEYGAGEQISQVSALKIPPENAFKKRAKETAIDKKEARKNIAIKGTKGGKPTARTKEEPVIVSRDEYQQLIDAGQDPVVLQNLIKKGLLRVSGK
jgi:hypothetical protein